MSAGVWNILDINEQAGEEFVSSLVSDFTTEIIGKDGKKETLSQDVEDFLKNNALQFAKEKKSVTYLVCDEDDGSLLGYFTLTHKAIEISPCGISKTYTRKIEKWAQIHEETDTYIISGFLIAQFSKNYGVEGGRRLSGDELMRLCRKELCELQHRIGGGLVYLDCSDKEKLVKFYEKHNFKKFGERTSQKDGKQYLQYMRFI